eukprot:5777329-Alexandrium_andersonii.AAC.1
MALQPSDQPEIQPPVQPASQPEVRPPLQPLAQPERSSDLVQSKSAPPSVRARLTPRSAVLP